MKNPFDFFDQIYLINLDSRPDRLSLAQEELKKACIFNRVIRFPAIAMPDNPCKGNHLSHAQCIRRAKESGAKNVLILEDDIEWLENPLLLKRVIPELPNDWDLFYLGANTERGAIQLDYHIAKLTFAYSTHAYAINSTLFDKLMELNENPLTVHNDVSMNNEVIPNYNCYVSIPLLAGQRDSFSDIQNKPMSSNQIFKERFYGNLIRKEFPVIEPTFVTFVIPTLGRKTLKRAVDSVINQTDWDWKANVVFDGIEPNYSTDNDHVKVVQVPKLAHAGLVRNKGIDLATTDWIAFLDDDDYVDQDYVKALKGYNDHDLVIFTYKDIKTGNIQPPQDNATDFRECNVGISFAVKTDFLIRTGIEFDRFSIEDFRFLDRCRSAGAKYVVTHQIKYFVGGIGGWVRKD